MDASRAHLRVLVAAVLVVLAAPAATSAQPVFGVLHAFSGGLDGAGPKSALIEAADGNFYGTTREGGAFNAGTVFRMTPAGTVTVLHAFAGGIDGRFPQAAVVQATDGNFYGTTSEGGGVSNAGTVFSMTPDGTVTVLHAFAGGTDGANPQASLIQTTDGNFYGTTTYGGGVSSGSFFCSAGCGTVFRMTSSGTVTVLHAFNHANGAYPAALIRATDGAFYGITAGDRFGGSTAFTMTPAGTVTTLHVFGGGFVGDSPAGALIQATDGNFYGTTTGVLLFPCLRNNCGTVFKMTPAGTVTVLHVFTGGPDGAYPTGSLIQAADGNLYGITTYGGGPSSSSCSFGCGTAFRMTPAGIVTALHAFTGGAGGATPQESLIQAADGDFYGTTLGAGAFGEGVVFRLIMTTRLLDLNGDGRGDVLLYNKATGERRFELANGLATGFTDSLGSWDPGWQIYAVNLNQDQYTDLFLYDPERRLWAQALNRNGDGTFTYTLGNWDRRWMVVPADLDGDGLSDMFVYDFTTGVWVKCLVDGAGGFKGYAAGSWDQGWTVYTSELNGDGRDDFLLYNRVTGVWAEAFSQPGLGAFDYPASGRWDPDWQVIPANLNRDGRTDLFLLDSAGVHVSALARAGGGFDYVGGSQWSPGWRVAPGDLNNDGLADLFLYNPETGVWVEAFSDGTGSFTYSGGRWDPGWSVAVTYFNGDGFADLILSRADGTWVQAVVTGPGTFTYTVGNWGPAWTVFARSPGD